MTPEKDTSEIFKISCENCPAQLELQKLITGCGTDVIKICARNTSIHFLAGFLNAFNIRIDNLDVPIPEQIQKFLETIGKNRLGVAYDDCIPGLVKRAVEKIDEIQK